MFQPDWRSIESEVGLDVRSAEPLGEGWSGWVYRVNEELVFKFPKRPDEWAEIEREISFLAYARPLLALPVVDHLYQVRRSAGAPHGYAVYRHIPGEAAATGESDGAGSELAATLARFLRALHGMDVGAPIEPPLTCEDDREVAERYARDARERIAPRLSRAARSRLGGVFERHLEDPDNFPEVPCVIHADLSARHVLCADGSVTGILDWGDVCLGDPDYDFGYLYGDIGEAFVRELASHYGHADPDRLVRKARYYWVIDQIDTIVYSDGRARAGDEEIAWRRLEELLIEPA